jgi:hypothetical protein
MLPVAQLDTIVSTRLLVWFDQPYTVKTWVEANDYQAEIDDLKQTMRELDPEDEQDEAEREQLKARIREYRDQAEPGHVVEVESGRTIGEHFWALDDAGRREFLKAYDIRAEKVAGSAGATRAARLVIDGVDHGIFPYPGKL